MNVDPSIHTALQHFRSGEHQSAEALCRRILKKQPQDADAWHILGLIARDANKYELALDMIGKAIALNPGAAIFLLNYGTVLQRKGGLVEAAKYYRKAIGLKRDYAAAYHSLALCLQDQGLLDEAVTEYQHAISTEQNNPILYHNLGVALKAQGKMMEALSCFNHALALNPNYALAHFNLGATLQDLGHLDNAIVHYRHALTLAPDHAESCCNMAVALQAQGRMAEAITCYEEALRRRPDFHDAHSNLLLALNYAAGFTPQDIYLRHLAWAQQHAMRFYPTEPRYTNIQDRKRRLRIGYVSPDYRRHAVAHFIDPVLAHHNLEEFDIYCYSNVGRPDDITRSLQRHPVQWRNIYGVPDEAVEELIRSDAIDILVDLAGHSANARLQLFARKPAPVQASWLGYLATTGLATMDYRVFDAHTAPPGLCEPYYTETIVRLPDTFVCYRAPTEAPEVGPLPALSAGYITFGSFNNFAKLTREVMQLWARVMCAVPNSRLMLKADGLNDVSIKQQTMTIFEQHGVDPGRLELLGRDASFDLHFSRYNQVDIGLDPFPCNGGTTSCDSIWMGVPVICLAGDSFISRMGVSMLTNVGIPELIADNHDDYIRLAADLAGNLDRLRELREGLRERMQSSPLMDAPRFVRSMEQAYRDMWDKWCSRNASA